ncbi:MAG: transcription-repair coupling factor, partial [Proteobacteria bacterium]
MSLIPKIGLPKGGTGSFLIDGVADGYEAFAIAQIVGEIAPDGPVVFVARDGQRLPPIIEALAFAAPDLPVLDLPAWDCLPYDRVSPGADAAARRLDALAGMAALAARPHRAIVLTTANALLQRVPPAALIEAQTLRAKPGNQLDMEKLVRRLENSGFERVPTVREVGEFAVRGGIVDLFAPGADEALRLDFFGDMLESIRAFDPASQRTIGQRSQLLLQPMSEVALTPDTISRFRRAYIEAFGAPSRDDALYAAVSEGRRFAGMEHWLPFFYERLQTIFDYLPDAPVIFDHLAHESLGERHKLILDHYDARRTQGALKDAVPYKPVPPQAMYLSPDEVSATVADRLQVELTPFAAPEAGGRKVFHAGARAGRSFAEERADPNANVFAVAARHIVDERAKKRRVIIAGWTEGSLDRLTQILTEHDLGNLKRVETLDEAGKLGAGQAALAVLPLETGFETDNLVVVAEQDILGDRLVRRSRKRRPADFIAEASSLSAGDIVVHADHGIGRFVGLRTIEAAGAPHDCLEIHYAGDDRLFLPVENIELLSRYGSDAAEATLDKLGGGAWQARKARLKKRLLDMAGQLIRIAAERQMRAAPVMVPQAGLYGEFAARFPYEETDDQQNAIDAVTDDLSAGKPMDRLICGAVGFGKTEGGRGAAFIAAREGFKVAAVARPTLFLI